eukprot:TRINITY_DN496_c0_g1_i5.p2 TRINITY_DN496_c0_g1~~TRINITY_DN496_c0_g1_i5.p2  ORF type:complete len:128 (+),score=3.60 TRINITY_DN496_c0_g1_i5:86-469(+)
MPSLVGSEMCIRDRYQRRVHGVVIGELTLENLYVKSSFGRKGEVETGSPVQRILADDSIGIGEVQCGKAAATGIDALCLQDDIAEVLRYGTPVLVDSIVSCLEGECVRCVILSIEGRTDVRAAVVET